MSAFYLLCGLPGCGKTTWANNFRKEHPNTLVVSSDGIRIELKGNQQDFSVEGKVWEIFDSRIEEYSFKDEDINVIADSTNLRNVYREHYAEKSAHYDKKYLVYFDVPFEICDFQNKLRTPDKVVKEEAMIHLKEEWEPISEEVAALYDGVIICKAITEEAKEHFAIK